MDKVGWYFQEAAYWTERMPRDFLLIVLLGMGMALSAVTGFVGKRPRGHRLSRAARRR